MLRVEMGFHTNVVDGMDCALYKPVNDTKVRGVGGQGYPLEGTQQARSKTIKKFMKSPKGKCEALNVEWTNPVNLY